MTKSIFITPQDFYFPVAIPLAVVLEGEIYPLIDKADALHETSEAFEKEFGRKYNCLWAIYKSDSLEGQREEFKKFCDEQGIPSKEHYNALRIISDFASEEIERANKQIGYLEDLFLDGSICISDVVGDFSHTYGENIRHKAMCFLEQGTITDEEYNQFRDVGLTIAQEFKAEAMRKWLKLYDLGIPVY